MSAEEARRSVPRRRQRLQASRAPDRNFICFEPMAGVTDALNLAHKGIYKELESIAPGGTWTESFWIKPSGFLANRVIA